MCLLTVYTLRLIWLIEVTSIKVFGLFQQHTLAYSDNDEQRYVGTKHRDSCSDRDLCIGMHLLLGKCCDPLFHYQTTQEDQLK